MHQVKAVEDRRPHLHRNTAVNTDMIAMEAMAMADSKVVTTTIKVKPTTITMRAKAEVVRVRVTTVKGNSSTVETDNISKVVTKMEVAV
jgi:hypothetical protein